MLLNPRGFGKEGRKHYECPVKGCEKKRYGFFAVPPQCPDHGLTMRIVRKNGK